MAKFETIEEAEAWLKIQQKEYSVLLAARAALRVVPLLYRAKGENAKLEATLILPVFRATAIPAFAGTWPEVGMAATRAAAYAFSHADVAARAVRVAAYAADGTDTVRAARAAAYAVDAVRTPDSVTYAAAYAADAADAAYAAFLSDVEWLVESSGGDMLYKLAVSPLWPEGDIPTDIARNWDNLRTHLESLRGQNWQVWTNWYEERLHGFPNGPPDMALEKARIERITEVDWNNPKNPAHVNGKLAAIEAEFKKRGDEEIPPELRNFFISYASDENEAVARRVGEALTSVGVTFYAQFQDFPPGSSFIKGMNEGLANSDRFIAIYSDAYWASPHCNSEWEAAYNKDPSASKRDLIGLQAEQCSLPPLAFRLVYKSLIGLSPEREREAILEAIGALSQSKSTSEKLEEITRYISPTARASGRGRLEAVVNQLTDRKVDEPDVADLPDLLSDACEGLLEGAPENAAPAMRYALKNYLYLLSRLNELKSANRLEGSGAAIIDELSGFDSHLWEDGALGRFSVDFVKYHTRFISLYPFVQEQETRIADLEVDVDRVTSEETVQAVEEALEDAEDFKDADGTEASFDEYIRDVQSEFHLIREAPGTSETGTAGNRRPQRKKRFIVTAYGFFESTLSVLSSSTTLLGTPAGKALSSSLTRAIEILRNLILN